MIVKPKRKIDTIVIHCSATRPSQDIGAKVIKGWHVNERGWKDIGYHDVIRRNGLIEAGRPLGEIGAHVANHNTGSIGICMVGGVTETNIHKAENNFTPQQWTSLRKLLKQYLALYPKIKIVGHRDLDRGKCCPSFDVAAYLRENPL